MLSSGLLYLSLLFAKQLASATRVPSSAQAHFSQCEGHISEPKQISGFFQPPTTYETYGNGRDLPSSFVQDNLQDTAVTIVQAKLGLNDGEVAYTSGYSAEAADYAYLTQSHHNIPFVNAVANIVLKNGKIVSFGSSFVKTDRIASPIPNIQTTTAIHAAERAFPGTYNGYPTKMEYFAKEDGSVALVHVVQVQDEGHSWFEVYVDAHNGEVISSTDYAAESGYIAIPIEKQNILDGTTFITDPQDTNASPLGWHDDGMTKTTDTSGNNVVAFFGNRDNTTTESESGLVFKYTYNTKEGPKTPANVDAARTNAFYAINTVHDFTYRYGFTEKAFNFQTNNFGKGGQENDRVLMYVLFNGGYNDAKFFTPADGQAGSCYMNLFNKATPYRDPDVDNSVIVHEMTHGISNRLTGGGTARCLNSLESRGLGEGWSDTLADWTEQTDITKDFTAGRYVMNRDLGIRAHPYSVDPKVNPLRFSDLNQAIRNNSVHQVGQIWANMLHNVYAALVSEYGYSSDAKTNPDGAEGNIVFLHLFIDSLATQPCYPTFSTARDAWIQADNNRYKGANKCLLWKVFASRGLGMDAHISPPYADGSAIPADCKA